MKKIVYLLVCLTAVFCCGCSNTSDDCSKLDSEKDAIIQAFGQYNKSNGKGVVFINEKKNEDDRTYVYHIAKLPSVENYRNTLRANQTEEIEKKKEEVYENIETESNKEVAEKIDKLYKNQNVDKIRVEVGVVWPYSKANYVKPGEDVVGQNIAYIKTYDFNRENYKKELKKFRENIKTPNKTETE